MERPGEIAADVNDALRAVTEGRHGASDDAASLAVVSGYAAGLDPWAFRARLLELSRAYASRVGHQLPISTYMLGLLAPLPLDAGELVVRVLVALEGGSPVLGGLRWDDAYFTVACVLLQQFGLHPWSRRVVDFLLTADHLGAMAIVPRVPLTAVPMLDMVDDMAETSPFARRPAARLRCA